MRVGNFSVVIPESSCASADGYVSLEHGQVYRLRLHNHFTDRRCDATVIIDGKDMGGYRLDRGGCITLERSSHDTGKFTFFRSDSSEAAAAGVANIANASRGLVQVRFQPEQLPKPVHIYRRSAGGQSCGGGTTTTDWGGEVGLASLGDIPVASCGGPIASRSMSSGITGLTGMSSQQFHTVSPLNYDPAEEVTITLRLVAANPAVRELKPQPQVKSNPVPLPVE
jgi:hypothetical protein